MILCWFQRTKFQCNLSFFILTGVFHGSLRTTDPRAVHSAWVFVIFGCVHTCLGESLETAFVEVKFNSLTLAALSFNTAKDLLVFSISPLSRSREIEFSLNIAYRRIVARHPNHIGASDKNVTMMWRLLPQ